MGIESRDSFTITANLGEFPTGSVHGSNEICPDQWGDDRPLDLLKFLGPDIYVNDRWS